MPTKRPRLLVTETDTLTAVLDAAGERWPELSRPQRLARLAAEGGGAMRDEAVIARRVAGVRASAGALPGAWPIGARRELRDEWPE